MKILFLILCLIFFTIYNIDAQIGYYDAPYVRYEADLGTLVNAIATTKSYDQTQLQSEASDQICVNLTAASASVTWSVTTSGDGLVVRYSVPDGQSGMLDVYGNGVFMGTMNLTSTYSWEYLASNGNPNNVGVVNTNPKMRFDEVRMKLPAKILVGQSLRLVRTSGTIYLDFAELEPIPAAVTASVGDVTFPGGNLQTFITNNGGATIFLPAGTYNVGSTLVFLNNNTTLKGAGMWYTQINFTSTTSNNGGLWGQASNISFSGLYLTTNQSSRSNAYKAINGVFTAGSTITNIWAEHFECGAWIAQYGVGPAYANNFVVSNCRFRNNYADGINLCKGTSNAIVEHCSFRNNGDDDMAVWPASGSGQEGQNNTFRFCTAENSWRSAGIAIYGGYSNVGHHLLIKDNLEVGIKVNNNFGGYTFNGGGMHQFYNIRIVSGGTYNDLFNKAVGAIDISVSSNNGTDVNNVKFSCIEIINSKNDAIYFNRTTGSNFNNFVFENITIDGTGKEYPNNGNGGSNGGQRGFGLLFWNYPGGYGTNCNITYTNRGGNAPGNVSTSQIGSFGWTVAGGCPGGCTPMPLELINFSGKQLQKTIELNWSSNNFSSTMKYILERSSNEENWKTIGEVEGSGNTTGISTYSFTDKDPLEGISFYRLKLHDGFGTFSYSASIVIHFSTNQSTRIFPNPFAEMVTIVSNVEGETEISIFDVIGNLVYTSNRNVGHSDSPQDYQLPELVSGLYFVRLKSKDSIEQFRLIRK